MPSPTHPGLGQGVAGLGLATLGARAWSGTATRAGGRGRWLRVSGTSQGGGRKKARELPHGILECGKTRAATAGRHWLCIRPPSWGERSSPARLSGPGGWPRAGLRDRRRRHRHIDLLAGWGGRQRGEAVAMETEGRVCFLAERHRISVRNQVFIPCPLLWKCGILTTGPPGKSLN